MSAYMIEPEAITFLICAAQEWHVAARNDDAAQDIGTMLYEENRRSVAYRYRDDAEMTGAPPYKWDARHPRWIVYPVQVLRTLGCLEYQSCERPDWEASEAARWIRKMRAEAISRVPGWNEADWGAPKPGTAYAIAKAQDEALRPAIHRAVLRDTIRLAEDIRKSAADGDVEGVRALARMLADAPEFARVDDDVAAYLRTAKYESFESVRFARESDDESDAQRFEAIVNLIESIPQASASIR